MKSLGFYLLTLAVLSVTSCGKKNESGKNPNVYDYANPYCAPGAVNCSPYSGAIAGINSQYQIANIAQSENPCASGTFYANARIPVQVPLTGLQGIVTSGDIFLGVTTYGDVAVIVGTGTNTGMLHAYLCPRAANSGQGQIGTPSLGAISQGCNIKPVTALTMFFPDGQKAAFRDPSYGIRDPYTGRKIRNFSFCPNSSTM